MANVMGIAQFVAGVRARALAPREFQVCLGGIEPYARCAEIRDRGRNHTRPAADIKHSLTRTDTGKFQEGSRQTTGPPTHKALITDDKPRYLTGGVVTAHCTISFI